MEGRKAVDELKVEWVVVNHDYSNQSSFEDSVGTTSSSSLDLDMVEEDDDDASSNSSSSSFRPFSDWSQLMAKLPIKRGLSKYYEGKSESFGGLGSVMSVEDLAKEGNSSYIKRMKSSCNYKKLDFDGRRIRSSFAPKSSIIKKRSSRSRTILSRSSTGTSPISLQRNF